MKKLYYLIIAIAALGLIVSGCIPVVPPLEENELSSTISKANTIVSEGVEYTVSDGIILNSDHKIRNKWDLKGSFTVNRSGYEWGEMSEGQDWNYEIHIKEAIHGDFSVGTIYFWTEYSGEIVEVTGHVKRTKQEYAYWTQWDIIPNLAASGTTVYDNKLYDFLFLFSENYIQFTLSDTEEVNIDDIWAIEGYWLSVYRDYDLWSNQSFDFSCKNIH
jgi:hypothetical protein